MSPWSFVEKVDISFFPCLDIFRKRKFFFCTWLFPAIPNCTSYGAKYMGKYFNTVVLVSCRAIKTALHMVCALYEAKIVISFTPQYIMKRPFLSRETRRLNSTIPNLSVSPLFFEFKSRSIANLSTKTTYTAFLIWIWGNILINDEEEVSQPSRGVPVARAYRKWSHGVCAPSSVRAIWWDRGD